MVYHDSITIYSYSPLKSALKLLVSSREKVPFIGLA